MKKCYTCQKEKHETEFNKNKHRKDGLNSICRTCSNKRSKRYYAENKDKHKKATAKIKKERIRKLHDFVVEYYKSHPCVDCGEMDYIVLEFDHVTGDKKYNIARLIRDGYSLKLVKEEIAKCEVRCANCHRRRTAKQRNWYNYGPVA